LLFEKGVRSLDAKSQEIIGSIKDGRARSA
jgi:hypothetical protein